LSQSRAGTVSERKGSGTYVAQASKRAHEADAEAAAAADVDEA